MKNNNYLSRRTAVKSSIFGMLAVSIPSIVYAKHILEVNQSLKNNNKLSHRYPAIDEEIVSEVVGVSHFNLDRLREVVNHRPELARATWDWGFGDWESAIGAASHVGRRDIANFLLSKGARPDIFTYAMLGAYEPVKAMIEHIPGIQSTFGPHGINLMQHVRNGFQSDELLPNQKEEYKKLISYLEELGNADINEENIKMTAIEKEKYIGDYKYGDNPKDGFSIKLNMRELLSLGKLGQFGGALYRKSDNVFSYNGAVSVEISFKVENDKVVSLTIHEPDLTLTARKV